MGGPVPAHSTMGRSFVLTFNSPILPITGFILAFNNPGAGLYREVTELTAGIIICEEQDLTSQAILMLAKPIFPTESLRASWEDKA